MTLCLWRPISVLQLHCLHVQVTAPQLALLENSMSKLERLNVYLLATDGGNRSGVNVFLVSHVTCIHFVCMLWGILS